MLRVWNNTSLHTLRNEPELNPQIYTLLLMLKVLNQTFIHTLI